MTRFKFRAWDSVKRNMMFIGEFPLYHEPDNGLHSGWTGEGGDWDSHVLMQFTGLKDKNGAEIYEGDILKVLHTDWPSKSNDDPRTIDEYMNDLSEKYLVGFEEGAFTMFYDGDKDSGHYIKCGTHGFIEVIGNIYENPELLSKPPLHLD